MATHSSVLAWRIAGTGDPGGLPSMGLQSRTRLKRHSGGSSMSTESMMPSNHLILCHPVRLLLSIFPNIRVFSSESAFCLRCPKYWNFSISPSKEYSELISFRIVAGLISLQLQRLSRAFSNTTV